MSDPASSHSLDAVQSMTVMPMHSTHMFTLEKPLASRACPLLCSDVCLIMPRKALSSCLPSSNVCLQLAMDEETSVPCQHWVMSWNLSSRCDLQKDGAVTTVPPRSQCLYVYMTFKCTTMCLYDERSPLSQLAPPQHT